MAYIPDEFRKSVATRALQRCEYCQCAELITGGPMHVEHIVAEVRGGLTAFDNLAYSCARCDLHKATRIRFRDPISSSIVPLFNPRKQTWSRNFVWSPDGTRIAGRTRTGRATVIALNMSDATIVRSRSLWVDLGVHPPA